MSTVDNTKRILADDFPEDDREFASQFGEIYNFTIENITNAINGQLNYDNLSKELVEITITVDANGTPTTSPDFIASVNMVGSTVIRAVNLLNFANYVQSHPFITYTRVQGEKYRIQNITGLNPDEKYQLLIELIPLA